MIRLKTFSEFINESIGIGNYRTVKLNSKGKKNLKTDNGEKLITFIKMLNDKFITNYKTAYNEKTSFFNIWEVFLNMLAWEVSQTFNKSELDDWTDDDLNTYLIEIINNFEGEEDTIIDKIKKGEFNIEDPKKLKIQVTGEIKKLVSLINKI